MKPIVAIAVVLAALGLAFVFFLVGLGVFWVASIVD
jgi:hypothetical protein